MFSVNSIYNVWDKLADFFITYGLKIVGAVIIFFVGLLVSKFAKSLIVKSLQKSHLDVSLVKFIASAADIVIKVLVVIMALSALNVSTAGLIAALSASAVAVSLALKDSLGNVAGGIMMLIAKPFSTGDVIKTNDEIGTVLRIDMIHTTILTLDNRRLVVPNGQLVNQAVVNFSKEEKRRVDLVLSIDYKNDTNLAKKLMLDAAYEHNMVLKETEPFCRISEYAESSINFTLRVWCNANDYWDVNFDLLEQIKTKFDENGVVIPFNQLDVHVIND